MSQIGTESMVLGIMVKSPKIGFSKTRLVPPLSPEEAASLSERFIRDTAANVAAVGRDLPWVAGAAVYTPKGTEEQFAELLPDTFLMIPQRGDELGSRVANAIEDLFLDGYAAVCLIGSDSPTLPRSYLGQMAEALASSEERLVIGPTEDGGYYAIGLRRSDPRLFDQIAWSTDRVFAQTLERAREIDLPAVVLPEWYDVDDGKTLDRLCDEILGDQRNDDRERGSPATHSKQYLGEIIEGEGSARLWPSHRPVSSVRRLV